MKHGIDITNLTKYKILMDGFLNNNNLFINTSVASRYPLKIFMKSFIFNNNNLKNIFINTAVASKYPLKCHCA